MLKEQGFKVLGVFMKNWDSRDEDGVCPSESDYHDARDVCQRLDIPLTQVNFVQRYWNEVFSPMVDDLATGDKTPNPDIGCNRFIK